MHGILDSVYQTGITAELKEIKVILGKRVRYFDLTYSARRDPLGKINGIMILGVEISEEVATREALLSAKSALEMEKARLKESESRFRELSESMPSLVWVTDGEGRATFFNCRWQEVTGTPTSELLGDGWLNDLFPEDRAMAEKSWLKSRKKKIPYDIEYRLVTKSGEPRWFLARGVPLLRQDGSVYLWVGTTTDIHDQKAAQEEVQDILESMYLAACGRRNLFALRVISKYKIQGELVKGIHPE